MSKHHPDMGDPEETFLGNLKAQQAIEDAEKERARTPSPSRAFSEIGSTDDPHVAMARKILDALIMYPHSNPPEDDYSHADVDTIANMLRIHVDFMGKRMGQPKDAGWPIPPPRPDRTFAPGDVVHVTSYGGHDCGEGTVLGPGQPHGSDGNQTYRVRGNFHPPECDLRPYQLRLVRKAGEDRTGGAKVDPEAQALVDRLVEQNRADHTGVAPLTVPLTANPKDEDRSAPAQPSESEREQAHRQHIRDKIVRRLVGDCTIAGVLAMFASDANDVSVARSVLLDLKEEGVIETDEERGVVRRREDGPDFDPADIWKLTGKKGPWRVGKTLGRTIYFQEKCVGMVDSSLVAETLVNAANAVRSTSAPRMADAKDE